MSSELVIAAILDAWALGLVDERVIEYVVERTGASVTEIEAAIANMYDSWLRD